MTKDFAGWFDSPLGKLVLARETEQLLRSSRRFHGDTLLWLGPVNVEGLSLDRCMVRHRIFGSLRSEALQSSTGNDFAAHASVYLGEPDSLPFPNSSIDALVLHHALESVNDPRAAIREVGRVLRPGGCLVFCGINPFSLFGLRCLLARWRSSSFSELHPVSPLRLLDWLAVLGFELDEAVQYLMFRAPLDNNGGEYPKWQPIAERLENWRFPLGGIYMVMARKAVVGMTEVGSGRKISVPGGLQTVPMPRPSTRQGS